MAAVAEKDGLAPGKVRNKTIVNDKYAVIARWDPPNAWGDGSTTDFTVAEAVSHYEVDLVDSSNVVQDQDLHVLTTRKRFKVAGGSTGWKVKVRAIGHDMEYTTEDAASGSATGEEITTTLPTYLDDNANPTTPGAAPVVARIPGGLNLIDMSAYSKPVDWKAFHVEFSTNGGSSWTSLGASGALAAHGQLSYTTTYIYRYRVEDLEGNFSGYSPSSAGVTGRQTAHADVANATIDMATQIQGLLPNANLSQITDPAKLADAIVTGAKIAAGTIDASAKIAAGTIVGNLIAASAIAAGNIAAGAIIAGKIAANAVTATEIAADAITSSEIQAGAVTAAKISVSVLSAISADVGSITAGTVTGATIRTASSGGRIAMSDVFGENDRINIYGSTGNFVGCIRADSGDLLLDPYSTGGAKVAVQEGLVIRSGSDLQVGTSDDSSNRIDYRGTTAGQATPAASHCYTWYDTSGATKAFKAKFPNGIVKTMANDA